jgi:hypothetical protein
MHTARSVAHGQLTCFSIVPASRCRYNIWELVHAPRVIELRHRLRKVIRGILTEHTSVSNAPTSIPSIASKLTSCIAFNRCLSRGGSAITSAFNRCSAASPVTGLDAAVGLSFAETQLATPGSGASRCALLYTAQTSRLCRCSLARSTQMNGSIRLDSSS